MIEQITFVYKIQCNIEILKTVNQDVKNLESGYNLFQKAEIENFKTQ